jgi:hypothetical protein
MSTAFHTDTNGDLLISLGKLIPETDPVVSAAIKLKHRLRLVLGEWFLDTRVGVPYFDAVYGVKNPDLELIRRLIRRIILSCEPINKVEKLVLNFDKVSRTLIYYFEATAEDGRTVSGGPGEPFIVSAN